MNGHFYNKLRSAEFVPLWTIYCPPCAWHSHLEYRLRTLVDSAVVVSPPRNRIERQTLMPNWRDEYQRLQLFVLPPSETT
jgi:hypothetical protein